MLDEIGSASVLTFAAAAAILELLASDAAGAIANAKRPIYSQY